MKGFADLHIHTIFSDGILYPEEIFQKAVQIGLSAISITDHDSVEASRQARDFKNKYPIEFIEGIEFSCYDKAREYHILGYYMDIENPTLNRYLAEFKKERYFRAQKIVGKLNSYGIPLEFGAVLETAGDAPLTRPHIARAMAASGYVASLRDAFTNFLGDGKPAYEPKAFFSVEKCLKLISYCGGISVLAHPARTISQQYLYKMIEMGLDGIEVIHPTHDKELQNFYHTIASQYWLIETGGSDYHGSRDYDEANFGHFVIPDSAVESMKYVKGSK